MLDEWYSPAEHVEMARRVMGGIDLDPASCELAQQTVKATRYLTATDDGLAHEWHGRIWINPPYSRGLITRFADKLIEEWRAGRVQQAIALVNAHPDGRWFQRLSAEFVLCLAHKRIKFYDGTRTCNPRFPSAFFYAGSRRSTFRRVFGQLGAIVEPGASNALAGAEPLHASCLHCGEPMPGARSHAIYHSTACRVAAHRARAKESP
jgi:ParB family chromosome partitioning protein